MKKYAILTLVVSVILIIIGSCTNILFVEYLGCLSIWFPIVYFWNTRKKKTASEQQPANTSTQKISYHKQFVAHGSKFECKLDSSTNRQHVIIRMRKDETFHLEKYEWKGKPAFMIVSDIQNLDIGVVPKEMVDKFNSYFSDDKWNTDVIFVDKIYSDNSDDIFLKFQFIVTRR